MKGRSTNLPSGRKLPFWFGWLMIMLLENTNLNGLEGGGVDRMFPKRPILKKMFAFSKSEFYKIVRCCKILYNIYDWNDCVGYTYTHN